MSDTTTEAVAGQIDGQTIILNARKFSTGSTGFYGTGKVVIDGKKYQVNMQAVLIGSKPESKGASTSVVPADSKPRR